MPQWTFGDILSRATTRIGRRSDVDQSDASFWALEALDQISMEHRDSLLESTKNYSVASGTSLLALPGNFFEPITLSVTSAHDAISAYTIEPKGIEAMDAQGYLPVGQPQGWCIYGPNIQLQPSCNSSANTNAANSGRSIQLRYYAFHEEPASLTSTISLDTGWHRAVMHLTASLIAAELEEYEIAAMEQANYAGAVNATKDALARRQNTKGRQSISLPLRASRRRAS